MRLGLTGSLGSGKSTVAAFFCSHGFPILEADAIARELMQPGQDLSRAIAEHFGPSVVLPSGALNRPRLAELAFREGRLAELNRIVHPPVIAEQERRLRALFAQNSHAIVIVESALIFETEAWGTVPGWRQRFDRILLVTAPDNLKIQRFLARILPADATLEQRAAAERDARARLAVQLPDSAKIPLANAVIDNSGSLDATRLQVDRLAAQLRAAPAV